MNCELNQGTSACELSFDLTTLLSRLLALYSAPKLTQGSLYTPTAVHTPPPLSQIEAGSLLHLAPIMTAGVRGTAVESGSTRSNLTLDR